MSDKPRIITPGAAGWGTNNQKAVTNAVSAQVANVQGQLLRLSQHVDHHFNKFAQALNSYKEALLRVDAALKELYQTDAFQEQRMDAIAFRVWAMPKFIVRKQDDPDMDFDTFINDPALDEEWLALKKQAEQAMRERREEDAKREASRKDNDNGETHTEEDGQAAHEVTDTETRASDEGEEGRTDANRDAGEGEGSDPRIPE